MTIPNHQPFPKIALCKNISSLPSSAQSFTSSTPLPMHHMTGTIILFTSNLSTLPFHTSDQLLY